MTDHSVKPLAIDLFAGLGGWTEGLLSEGWDVIGFDIEQHAYDGERYPAQLVLQDVRTLHGSQFKSADLIVASPPCQFFSYTAMPWTKAKERAARTRADPELMAKELELFNACFRIQREACEAAGRHIPMVVENVRGAIPWVGRSAFNFGSYHLWGDVPALMPSALAHKVPGFRFDGSGRSFQTASVEGMKGDGRDLGVVGFNVSAAQRLASNADAVGYTRTADDKRSHIGGRRKAASARIAKIPLALSTWIARVYFPRERKSA